MKRLLHLLVLVCSASMALAQPAPLSLKQLDNLLYNPLHTQLVTNKAYSKLLYQQQVKLSGIAVQQGKTLGTNATVDDKGGTLNIGTPAFGFRKLHQKGEADGKPLAVQFTVKGSAEDGLVKLFTDEKYQKTLSYGGTVIIFGNAKGKFKDKDRKNFHGRLRQLRAEDAKTWSSPLTPYDVAKWESIYRPKAEEFLTIRKQWAAFLTTHPTYLAWYNDEGHLSDDEVKDLVAEKLYLDYVTAEHEILPLLGANWQSQDFSEEKSVIDSLSTPELLTIKLEKGRLLTNKKKLNARANFYDSLQQKTSWSGRSRLWFTASVFYNTVKQPVFSAANKAQTYADVLPDSYWQQQVAFNFLHEGGFANIYLAGGVGLNNMLVFSKKDLLTYQTSKRVTKDSILVVTQKQLYSTTPQRTRYVSSQLQAAITFPSLQNGGLSLSANALCSTQDDAPNQFTYTLGVFVPVQAEKTTLLVMPLVRWKNTDQPNPWTIGFSITASVPGLLK